MKKVTEKHKRKIALAISKQNKELAVYYADKYNMPPQDFAKMVIEYSNGKPITGRKDGQYDIE